MSAPTRLLGKDVEVRITRGGRPQATITAVKNLAWTINTRILEEMYLGENRNRLDAIYESTGVSLVIHPESADLIDMIAGIANRAISRDPNADQVTIIFRVSFPNGETRRITLPQVEFDPIPFNVSSRDAYVDVSLSGKCETFNVA